MNKQEVLAKIGKKNWDAFCEFMEGQTVSVNKNGETDFYEYDVENFINKMKGKATFFD